MISDAETTLSVYTTVQAAQKLGVADGTIRGYKSKHSDELQEHLHWGKGDDDVLWWTEQGLQRLSELIPSATPYTAKLKPLTTPSQRMPLQPATPAQRSPLQTTTPNTESLQPIALTPAQHQAFDPEIERAARMVIACGFSERVQQRIQQIIFNPTPEQAEWKQSLVQSCVSVAGFRVLADGLQTAVEASKASLKGGES